MLMHGFGAHVKIGETVINLSRNLGLPFLAEVVKMEASPYTSALVGHGRLSQLRLLFVALLVMCICEEAAQIVGSPLQTITLNINNHFTKAFTLTTSQAILGTVQPRSQATFPNVIFAGFLFVADEDDHKTRSAFPLTWIDTDAANTQVQYQHHQLRGGRPGTTPRRNLLVKRTFKDGVVVVGIFFQVQKDENSALMDIVQLVDKVKGAPSPSPFPGPPAPPSPSPPGGDSAPSPSPEASAPPLEAGND